MKKTLYILLAMIPLLMFSFSKEAKPKREGSIEGMRNKILEQNDLNKDGKLDAAEIDGMLQKKKEKRDSRRQQFLDQYDFNKNGKLDEEEKAKAKSDRLQSRSGDGVKTIKK